MAKTFMPGEVLTADDVNTYLVNPDDGGGPEVRAARNITVPSGSGGVNVNVDFSSPFDVIPVVILTVDHPNLVGARVTSTSVSGFTARFDRSGSSSYSFNYIAMVAA